MDISSPIDGFRAVAIRSDLSTFRSALNESLAALGFSEIEEVISRTDSLGLIAGKTSKGNHRQFAGDSGIVDISSSWYVQAKAYFDGGDLIQFELDVKAFHVSTQVEDGKTEHLDDGPAMALAMELSVLRGLVTAITNRNSEPHL